jgi:hypothetical protein
MAFRRRPAIGLDERKRGKYNADGEAAFMNGFADGDLGTISLNGTTYQIEDYGYVCGETFACFVLSQFSCLFSPAPYCAVCATCWHVCGKSRCPDWILCGEPVDDYGLLVRFKPAWREHCLGLLGYGSIAGQIEGFEPPVREPTKVYEEVDGSRGELVGFLLPEGVFKPNSKGKQLGFTQQEGIPEGTLILGQDGDL